MRQSRASAYATDWEYENNKREERKKAKRMREQRKNKRNAWEPVE